MDLLEEGGRKSQEEKRTFSRMGCAQPNQKVLNSDQSNAMKTRKLGRGKTEMGRDGEFMPAEGAVLLLIKL